MSVDPPENLYQRLNELEATVRGLTQELVEANERIRQLEADRDRETDEQMTTTDTESTDEHTTEEEKEAQLEDDIIVA